MGIVIIGSGSIGMLVTFYLSKQVHHISLLTNRPEQAQIINEKGVKLILQDRVKESLNVCACPLSDIQPNQSIDLLILAVKSYQVEGVLTKIEALHIKVHAVLFLQNGMAHTEGISTIAIPEIAVAVVEHGAVRENDFTVHHTGIGQIRWSYVRKGKGSIESLLSDHTASEFKLTYDKQWGEMLERKLVVNACINPLTGLFQVKNGELLTNNYYLSMMKMVFNEVMIVLDLERENDIWDYVKEVCAKTAENQSSMLLDMKHSRQTEIDSIIGYLIRRAERQRQTVFILSFLFQGIRAKEKEMGVNKGE